MLFIPQIPIKTDWLQNDLRKHLESQAVRLFRDSSLPNISSFWQENRKTMATFFQRWRRNTRNGAIAKHWSVFHDFYFPCSSPQVKVSKKSKQIHDITNNTPIKSQNLLRQKKISWWGCWNTISGRKCPAWYTANSTLPYFWCAISMRKKLWTGTPQPDCKEFDTPPSALTWLYSSISNFIIGKREP